MVLSKCIGCKTIFETGNCHRKEYRSHLCNNRHHSKLRQLRNRDNPEWIKYHNKKSREWYQDNKERQKKAVLADYYKNKVKWSIRAQAREHRAEIIFYKGNICELCFKNEIEELHHEEYKRMPEEVMGKNKDRHFKKIIFLSSIIKGLCKECHIRADTQKSRNSKDKMVNKTFIKT